MRKLLYLAILSIGISSFAQRGKDRVIEVPGWEVRNNKLVWSKIYFAERTTINDFTKGFEFLVKNSSVLRLTEEDTQSIMGSFSNLTLKFEEFGYNLIDTPFLISRARHSGNIEVEIKEGRYKVILTDIVSFLNTSQKKGSVYRWNEDFLDRKGDIKKEMKETLELADKNFAQAFDVKSQMRANKKP